MIKKTIIGLAAALLFSASYAQEFPGLKEGTDYVKIKVSESLFDNKNKKPTLVEFFWYGCPHCFAMKPMIEDLVKTSNNKYNFVHYPVGFESWDSGGKMFFTFEEMNILDKMHTPAFNEFHVKRKNILMDVKTRDSFLKENNVDPVKFNTVYNSFSVNSKWIKAQKVTSAFKVEGSPDYAVYTGGYIYKVSPGLVNGYEKTLANLKIILTTKAK